MNRPAPPPEAALIRLVREAANITITEAARRYGEQSGRSMSRGWWNQIEAGYQRRVGTDIPVRNVAARVIAHMAAVLAISPERLESEGERADAAEVLREILRSRETLSGPVGDLISSIPAWGTLDRAPDFIREIASASSNVADDETKLSLIRAYAERRGLLPAGSAPDPVGDLISSIPAWGTLDRAPDFIREIASASARVADDETKLSLIRAYAERYGLLPDGQQQDSRPRSA